MGRGGERRILEGHRDAVWACAFSPDGRLLASGSYDQTLRGWSVETGRQVGEHRLGWKIYGVAFDPAAPEFVVCALHNGVLVRVKLL